MPPSLTNFIVPQCQTVGFIGLGKMGILLAKRLCRYGRVVAFNRTPAKGTEIERLGGLLVKSPAAVCSSAILVMVAVTGVDDVREVLLGPDGVRAAGKRDIIVVVLSTIDPFSSFELARELGECDIDMLDAPMSGSVHDAENGTLGFLVGGKSHVLDRARPALEKLGQIYYFGPIGSGCIAKLALNLLLAAMVQSLGEAFYLLGSLGLSRERFLSAIAGSGLSSPLFERVGTRVLANDFDPRYCLQDLAKDISHLQRTCEKLGIELRMSGLLQEIITQAANRFSAKDYSALVIAEINRITSE